MRVFITGASGAGATATSLGARLPTLDEMLRRLRSELEAAQSLLGSANHEEVPI